jgi:hypothetical protein
MVHQYKPNFPHKLNKHGFYDSVCTLCNLTIASAKNEGHLAQYEADHTCNVIRLFRIGRFPFLSGLRALQR